MDKLCKVGANRFHFIFGIRIAVWNPVYNFIEIIVFFDDVKACAEINIAEICYVGNPVVHFCNTIRGINALVGQNRVINFWCNCLCTDVLTLHTHKYRQIIFQFYAAVVQLVRIPDQTGMEKRSRIRDIF